jgi:thiamine biosynthesis lipoprotein
MFKSLSSDGKEVVMKKLMVFVLALVTVMMAGCSSEKVISSSNEKLSEAKTVAEDEVKNVEISDSRFVLGTIVTIQIKDYGTADLLENCFELLTSIENKMSTSIMDSDVWLVNQNAGLTSTKVSEETAFVIKNGIHFGELSDGHFDISIGPLVNLWKIGSDDAKVPKPQEIEDARKYVDYQKINLNQGTVSIEEGMSMDLGGIAKGYAADRVSELLIDHGVTSAIINLGGNVKVIGKKPNGNMFKIGVQNPFDGRNSYLGIISTSDMSIVSSGDYERFFIEDGIKYHHIFDKSTGYPVVTEVASVSVITPDGIKADALSTVFFSLDVDKGFELANQLGDVHLIYVLKDKTVYVSKGIDASFELTDKSFHVVVK